MGRGSIKQPHQYGMIGLRRSLFSLAVVLVGLGLSACAPTWDWREVRPDGQPVAMMLPAKPAEMSRAIDLNGLPVQMTMHGALVQGQRFTAAWLRLATGTQTDQPLQSMQTGMLRNIEGSIDRQEARTIRLMDASGRPVGERAATFIDAHGQALGKPVRMQAVFAADGNTLAQFVVMGMPWSDEAAATFFDSIALRQTGQ